MKMENDTKVDEKKTLTAHDLILIMQKHLSEMEKRGVELSYAILPAIGSKCHASKLNNIYQKFSDKQKLSEKETEKCWRNIDTFYEEGCFRFSSYKTFKSANIETDLNVLLEITKDPEVEVYFIQYTYELARDECAGKKHHSIWRDNRIPDHDILTGFYFNGRPKIASYCDASGGFEDSTDPILEELKRGYTPLKRADLYG